MNRIVDKEAMSSTKRNYSSANLSPLCHMPGVPEVWVFAEDARTTPEFGKSCFTRRPVYILLHVALQKKSSGCRTNYFVDALNQEHPRTALPYVQKRNGMWKTIWPRIYQYYQRLEVLYHVFAKSRSILIPLAYITGSHHTDINWQNCHPYVFGFVWEYPSYLWLINVYHHFLPIFSVENDDFLGSFNHFWFDLKGLFNRGAPSNANG